MADGGAPTAGPPLPGPARSWAAGARTVAGDRVLLLACLAVVLARASTVWLPLRPDEGGYLLLARRWHGDGEFVYGDYFVDRPPLLLLLFRVAALGSWDGWVRVLAVPFAVLFVLAAWRAGTCLGGVRGARWAAAVAAAGICSPAFAGDSADGELFATSLGMAGVALALWAWRARGTDAARSAAVAAGALAVLAPTVKQNAVDAAVVLAVLVAVGLRRGGPARRRAVVVLGGAVAGGVLAALPWLLWASATGVDPGAAWREVYAFRGAALDVVWSVRPRATVVRAVQLALIAAATGLAGVLLTWGLALRARRTPRRPEVVAVTVLLPVSLAAVVAGGSFWPSYLVQLLPVTVLVVGASAPSRGQDGRRVRAWARLLVATAVVGWAVELVLYAVVPGLWAQQRTGEWLAASSRPGDTAVVLYGQPSVLEAADLPSPYPYVWSVPVRVLDGDLDRLRATLVGDEAPTWVVEADPPGSWGMDDGGRLREVLHQRYRVVAEVCGHPVHLRADLDRRAAPAVRC